MAGGHTGAGPHRHCQHGQRQDVRLPAAGAHAHTGAPGARQEKTHKELRFTCHVGGGSHARVGMPGEARHKAFEAERLTILVLHKSRVLCPSR